MSFLAENFEILLPNEDLEDNENMLKHGTIPNLHLAIGDPKYL